jgi:hypothetical protein
MYSITRWGIGQGKISVTPEIYLCFLSLPATWSQGEAKPQFHLRFICVVFPSLPQDHKVRQTLSFTWDFSLFSSTTRSQGDRFGWVKPQFHMRFFCVFFPTLPQDHKVREFGGAKPQFHLRFTCVFFPTLPQDHKVRDLVGQNLSFTWDLSVFSFPPCHMITRWGKTSVSPEIYLCFLSLPSTWSQGEGIGQGETSVSPEICLCFLFLPLPHDHKVRELDKAKPKFHLRFFCVFFPTYHKITR